MELYAHDTGKCWPHYCIRKMVFCDPSTPQVNILWGVKYLPVGIYGDVAHQTIKVRPPFYSGQSTKFSPPSNYQLNSFDYNKTKKAIQKWVKM